MAGVPEKKPQFSHEALRELKTSIGKIDPTLKALNDDKLLRLVTELKYTNHSGPIPPPEQLQEYNTIIKEGAERIMVMAEKEQDHRIKSEGQLVRRILNQSSRGQILGSILAVIAIGGAIYLAMNGHEYTAVAVGGSFGISSIISAFAGRAIATRRTSQK